MPAEAVDAHATGSLKCRAAMMRTPAAAGAADVETHATQIADACRAIAKAAKAHSSAPETAPEASAALRPARGCGHARSGAGCGASSGRRGHCRDLVAHAQARTPARCRVARGGGSCCSRACLHGCLGQQARPTQIAVRSRAPLSPTVARSLAQTRARRRRGRRIEHSRRPRRGAGRGAEARERGRSRGERTRSSRSGGGGAQRTRARSL